MKVPTTVQEADALLNHWNKLEEEYETNVEIAKDIIRANGGSEHFMLKGGGERTTIDWKAAAKSVGITEDKAQAWAKKTTTKPSVVYRTMDKMSAPATSTTVEVKVL